MKAFLKYTIVLAAAAVLSGCFKEDGNRFRPGQTHGNGGGTAGMDFGRLTASNHPRLLMDAAGFDALKEKLAAGTDVNLAKVHGVVMSIANGSNAYGDNSTLKYELDASGKRILTQSRKALTRIFYCAYAYRMTGEQKYLTKAEADINTVCDFQDWNASRHFLDAGEMAAAVAIGYDWLYNELSSATKAKAVKAIKNFAFTPSTNESLAWFYDQHNNWNQVCNAGLVCGAIAIYENASAEAKAIIEKAVKTNKPAMEAMYSPDGNYSEGYSYWCYGTGFQVLMIAALNSALGDDGGLSDVKGFAETGRYMLYMVGMNDKCFNYSDCAQGVVPAIAQWWFADHLEDPSLLYNEMRFIEANKYPASDDRRLIPMIMSFANNIDMSQIKAPTGKVWSGRGETPVVLVHTDWSWGVTDKYLGVKGGKANSSHGHQDAGSFVYDAYGQRWSMDFGLQSYTTLENALSQLGGNLWDYNQSSMRWNVFRLTNTSHSTITVNDAKHRVAGSATLTSVVNTATEQGAVMNLTNAVSDQASSANRTVKIVNDTDLVVIDVVKALPATAAKVRWNMVTPATPTVETGRIKLEQGGKTMYLTVDGTVNHTFRTWSTTSTNSYDQANPGTYMVGFESNVPANTTATFTVKLSPNE